MSVLKITQSLISSWDRAFMARDELRDQYWKEFLDALHRKKRPDTMEQHKGRVFEAGVYAMANGERCELPHGMVVGARLIADIVRGGTFQMSLRRRFDVGPHELLLVGVPDVVKAGVIYDVKFRTKGFGTGDVAGKWLGASQHSAYFFLLPEAYEFQYLSSDGADLYTERYLPRSTMPFPHIASEFIGSLHALDLFDIYEKHWRVE